MILLEIPCLKFPIDSFPLSENRDNVRSKGIIDKYDMPLGIMEFTVYRELLGAYRNSGAMYRNP